MLSPAATSSDSPARGARPLRCLARGLALALLAVTTGASASSSVQQERATDLSYARDIAPLIARACSECHGRTQQKVGLRLDQRAAALAGSDFGKYAVIVPGDRDASLLWELVESGAMPPTEGAALTADEVELLGRWIDEGAAWPDNGEPASWPSTHWSYQALERPAVPADRTDWARNDVDRFLVARLNAAGLSPSPEAERGQLLRRASLDLTGLPPTDDEYTAFAADERPDAWEQAIERLLASPHYGEQQARRWLDLARYADSNGYEKDGDRSIWPWRDWVVRSFNEDLPFDQFTIEQLAGDLLPDATLDQRLATGFHRNTMTNDEGGTDAEEFRVAAVIDRVNTTGETWLGTTLGCVQCHDHKYDPITQRDYYRLFAVFNQTADGGKENGPMVAAPSPEEAARLAEIDAEEATLRARLRDDSPAVVADRVAWAARVRSALSATAPLERADVTWVAGSAPPAASLSGDWQPWFGPTDDAPGPAPRSGTRAIVQTSDTFEQHYFEGARAPLVLGEDDRFFFHVWIDPELPTRELLLQFHTAGGDWEHRAYFGEDLHGLGAPDTASRYPAGALPEPDGWRRLEVNPLDVGLEPGARVDGFAFGQWAGRVWWDDAGVTSEDPAVHAGVPARVAEELLATLGDELPESARDWHRETTPLFASERERLAELAAARPSPPQSMVLQAVAEPRTTHVLKRGSFLSPGEEVFPAVPAVLDPRGRARIDDRLDLARWLVSGRNPLTTRVIVNRLWAWTFGRGLVTTPDDFGTQGARPTHPELLDWLAVEFKDSGWSVKQLYRTLCTSAAYRQSSSHPATATLDPGNRLLSWFPRRRLDGEELRDLALVVSGTLNAVVGGPPVYPPQPEGIDNATYAGDRWRTSEGADALRRGLYTFWRRTSPFPSFVLFDAPSRELTCGRRDRSNTPLQALALLNDPNFVAAAEAFGVRLKTGGLERGFFLCTGRDLEPDELAVLETLRASDGWTAVAQVLLNLDETLTR